METTLSNICSVQLDFNIDENITVNVIRIIYKAKASFTTEEIINDLSHFNEVESDLFLTEILNAIRIEANKTNEKLSDNELFSWWYEIRHEIYSPTIEITVSSDMLLSSISDTLERENEIKEGENIDNSQKTTNFASECSFIYAYTSSIAPMINIGSPDEIETHIYERISNVPISENLTKNKINTWLEIVRHPERGILPLKSGVVYPLLEYTFKKNLIKEILRAEGGLNSFYNFIKQRGIQNMDDLIIWVDFKKDNSENGIIFSNIKFQLRPEMKLWSTTLQEIIVQSKGYYGKPPSEKTKMIEKLKKMLYYDVLKEVIVSPLKTKVVFTKEGSNDKLTKIVKSIEEFYKELFNFMNVHSLEEIEELKEPITFTIQQIDYKILPSEYNFFCQRRPN